MLTRAAFSLLAAASLVTALAAPAAARSGADDGHDTPPGGTLIITNGDHNTIAGRDLLTGSNHTAGTGHSVGLASPDVLTVYQITNATGGPIVYAQCQSRNPCTITPGTGTRIEAGQTSAGFTGDNVFVNFALGSVDAQGRITATGGLALPREYPDGLCDFATNVTCTSTASSPEPYNATVTVTAITGPPPSS
ncbi:hypothetical protein ACH4F6_23815 [Streptomyces sp. NPDC017936]|uniref:hypothetical protein n=1 Tax=Streptomyces sp. NPDC017936 TaxID=3365016 RepID=UPI003787CA48